MAPVPLMAPNWCWSSLIRVQVAPVSSERKTSLTPEIVPIRCSAW
jgi:hypothetical protein